MRVPSCGCLRGYRAIYKYFRRFFFFVGRICFPVVGRFLRIVPEGRYEAELSSTRAALDEAINQIALVSATMFV